MAKTDDMWFDSEKGVLTLSEDYFERLVRLIGCKAKTKDGKRKAVRKFIHKALREVLDESKAANKKTRKD